MTQAAPPLRNLCAAGLVVAAGVTYWLHDRQPYSEPEETVVALFHAAGVADLAGMRSASSHLWLQAFIGHFGEVRYTQVVQAYQRAATLGIPQWREIKYRTMQLASTGYDRLRERHRELGLNAFQRLPLEERLRLIEDPALRDAHIAKAGYDALSPEERGRISSLEQFGTYQDRQRFVDREGWAYASPEDRALLGAPSALSSEESAERTAFLDRVGRALLDDATKSVIGSISRAELSDAPAFKQKYGVEPATAYLKQARVSIGSAPICSFPAADDRGSLFAGGSANCVVTVAAHPRLQVNVLLKRDRARWVVDVVDPAIYQIWGVQ
jgi:hypothetical protein